MLDLLEGLATTRAIRRYTDEPVPDEALATMLFAATRAPTGSNRQGFRFMVLRDGPVASEVKTLLGGQARAMWEAKERADGYGDGSGADPSSPKARMRRTMASYVESFERVPVVVLPWLLRHRAPDPADGGSIYPACQNLLLAARALGFGGVLTGFHRGVERQIAEAVGAPQEAWLAATITIGRPAGSHGPVRRRPLSELVSAERWGEAPAWALDPPGTRHTAAGPPRR